MWAGPCCIATEAAPGIGPGDEVITSAYSFVATALAVLQHNAIPVFVDIEPETCGIDPRKIEAAITPRTKVILPVHIHGTPCDLQPIRELAQRHKLILIEDAAQAHGALYQGKPVGSIGTAGCFSTQSSKTLACGEGGLLVTSDDEVWTRASRMRTFGEDLHPTDEATYSPLRPLDGTRAYDSLGMGWMYRTNEMSAALARSQLGRLPEVIDNARRNAELLSRCLPLLIFLLGRQRILDPGDGFEHHRCVGVAIALCVLVQKPAPARGFQKRFANGLEIRVRR